MKYEITGIIKIWGSYGSEYQDSGLDSIINKSSCIAILLKRCQMSGLIAVTIKSTIFWDIMPYSLLKVHKQYWEYIASIFRVILKSKSCLLYASYLVDSEAGVSMFLHNVELLLHDMAFHPRK
jgi:hypothetical protein